MKLQFNVQMSRQYLFDFFLQHTYRTLRGKLSLLAGLAMIPLCAAYLEPGGKNVQRVLYIFRCIFPAPDAGKTLDQGGSGIQKNTSVS